MNTVYVGAWIEIIREIGIKTETYKICSNCGADGLGRFDNPVFCPKCGKLLVEMSYKTETHVHVPEMEKYDHAHSYPIEIRHLDDTLYVLDMETRIFSQEYSSGEDIYFNDMAIDTEELEECKRMFAKNANIIELINKIKNKCEYSVKCGILFC